MDFLHAHADRKLTLVSAAAGYGKTGLLVDFAHETNASVAWCALDEGDQDLAIFVAGLIAALRRCAPSFGQTTGSLLAELARQSQGAENLARTLAREVDEQIDEYCVLVLDDYHLVEAAAPIERFFVTLLAQLPEQLRLVVASRTIPPFPMVALVARQEVAGLGEEHLRFTPAEVQALFALQGKPAIALSEVEALVAHTEGWITGLLLTARGLSQDVLTTWLRASQTGEPVYDYLAVEVLAKLPAELQTFLLEAAALPEMDAALCDAVLGRADSADLLQLAETQRLFITGLGEGQRTFRYHHLFRDFLLKQMERSRPARLRELQARAGGWYEQHGWPATAITLYLRAGDLPAAVRVVEAQARAMFRAGQYDTLRSWQTQLTAAAARLPNLHLYLAKIDTDAGDFRAALRALDQAESGFQAQADKAGQLEVAVQRGLLAYRQGEYAQALAIAEAAAEEAEIHALTGLAGSAWRYVGLAHFALGQAQRAQPALEKGVRLSEAAHDEYNLAWACHDLARVQRALGQTAPAALAQRRALHIWRANRNIGPLATALNNIGWDQHMLGQYEAALATYAEALDYARRAGLAYVEILVLAGRGDLLVDLGDHRAAEEAYHQAVQLAETAQEVGLLRYLYLAFARLERSQGRTVSAAEWLRRAQLVSVAAQAESVGSHVQTLRGLLLLDSGRPAEALPVLAEACAALEAAGAAADLAYAAFGLARALLASGQPAEALASLRRALDVADRVGYDQMLVSEALPAEPLLLAAQPEPGLSARALALLHRARAARRVRGSLPDEPAPAPATATLELHALGGSRIAHAGRDIPRSAWGSQLPRELLFFIADRMPVDREVILQTFWPQMSAARASANFHQTLYLVRRALKGEAIVFDGQAYRLAPGLLFAYDVAQFERQALAAIGLPAGDLRRLPALQAALALYGGEYLADLPVEWAQNRRRALSELYVETLHQCALELMQLALYGEARDTLTRALAVDPLRDDLHLQMLLCLGALGRRHEVVEHYHHYRALLQQELGLDPPVAARELYTRLIY